MFMGMFCLMWEAPQYLCYSYSCIRSCVESCTGGRSGRYHGKANTMYACKLVFAGKPTSAGLPKYHHRDSNHSKELIGHRCAVCRECQTKKYSWKYMRSTTALWARIQEQTVQTKREKTSGDMSTYCIKICWNWEMKKQLPPIATKKRSIPRNVQPEL